LSGSDVSSDGTIVSVAKGGQAEKDGLLRPADRVVEVDGERLAGRTLGSMLGKVKKLESVEVTLRRLDSGLADQLQAAVPKGGGMGRSGEDRQVSWTGVT
jgi:C-terminal processing protease CtpA/Prc